MAGIWIKTIFVATKNNKAPNTTKMIKENKQLILNLQLIHIFIYILYRSNSDFDS